MERLFLRLPGDPIYAPETTVPHGAMRELELPPALQPFVTQPMFYEERFRPGEEVVEHVMPDGASRLIVELHGEPTIRLVGASAAPAVLRQSGHLRGFSLTLQPGAANALFGVPAHAIAGRAVGLHDVSWPAAREVTERLVSVSDDAQRVALLLTALARGSKSSAEEHSRNAAAARHAVAIICRRGGQCTMAELAGATGLGERRLQQLFKEHLGLPPRTWMRLARLHQCLRLMRTASFGWAQLAAEAGYSDQSHLSNEFRALSGLTPSRFLGISGSSKTSV